MLRNRAGFSLLELLATVAIISVLSSLAVFSYQWTIDTQRNDRAESNLRQLRNGMEAFFLRNRTFANNLNQLGMNPTDDTFSYQVAGLTPTNFSIRATRIGGDYSFFIDRDGNITSQGTIRGRQRVPPGQGGVIPAPITPPGQGGTPPGQIRDPGDGIGIVPVGDDLE